MVTEKRIITLETKLAFQEETIQELNKTLFGQQQQLDKLELALKGLVQRTKELSEIAHTNAPLDEKPPHY